MSIFEDLRSAPSHIMDGELVAGSGATFLSSIDPYSGEVIWSGCAATASDVEHAVQSARQALSAWQYKPYEERRDVLARFVELVAENEDELVRLITAEAGKPLRDARLEVTAIAAQFSASVSAYESGCGERNGTNSKIRLAPYGVLAVVGPFNFPLSMANGHIMPALLAGNSVVFKPSEHTPLCGVAAALLWQRAGLPKGTLNCLAGGKSVGEQLIAQADIDGILFVGGQAAGMAIFNAFKDNLQKFAALRMGGNNPLIVHDVPADSLKAVSAIVIQSAFAGGGQHCAAARRLIVNRNAEQFIEQLVADCTRINIGDPSATDPEAFYGPLITPIAARNAQARFKELVEDGATALVEPVISGPDNSLMSPGIADVTDCASDRDEEILAPVLKVYRYDGDLDTAITMARDTSFGLSAGIICSEPADHQRASREIRSGIFAWNQPLTTDCASAPVVGVGHSGNLGPAGPLSCGICARPVVSHEAEMQGLSAPALAGLD